MADTKPLTTVDEGDTSSSKKAVKKSRGILSRIFNGIFRFGNRDDFEKRLQHISKEEATVLARMKNRSRSWTRIARNLIVFSLLLEVVAISYAVMTTRSIDLNWKMRALRVLPMFLLPAVSSILYYTLMSFTRMRDRKDQKTLERLRDERQAKINELKELTNYYNTQQLIQKYDPDPAAKAAAASVLASKLGADSGLKVYLGDESMNETALGKSNDIELVQSKGLRNRKQSHSRSSTSGNNVVPQSTDEMPGDIGFNSTGGSQKETVVVDHHPRSTVHDGGWFARAAALLVGEDPTESYALICGNCHMHNGLARKEDFPYITYYCPHCHALNRSQKLKDDSPVSRSSNTDVSESPSNVDAAHSVIEDEPLTANIKPSVKIAPSEDMVADELVD